MLTKAEADLKEYVRAALGCECSCWACWHNDPVATDPFCERHHPDKCRHDTEGICNGYEPIIDHLHKDGVICMMAMNEIDCRNCKKFNL